MVARYFTGLSAALILGCGLLLPGPAAAVLVEMNVAGNQEQIAGTTLTLVDQDSKPVPPQKRDDRAGGYAWDVPAGTYTMQATDNKGRKSQQALVVPVTGKVSGTFDAVAGKFTIAGAGAAGAAGVAAGAAPGDRSFRWSVGPTVAVFGENRRVTAGFRIATPPNLSFIDFTATNDHIVAAPLLDAEARWRVGAFADGVPAWLLAGLMMGGGFSGDFLVSGNSAACQSNTCMPLKTALDDKRTGMIWAPYFGLGANLTDRWWLFGSAGVWAEHHEAAATFGNQLVVAQNQGDFRPFLGAGGAYNFSLCRPDDASVGLGVYYLFEGGRMKTVQSQNTQSLFIESQSRGSVAGMAQFNIKF